MDAGLQACDSDGVLVKDWKYASCSSSPPSQMLFSSHLVVME